MNREMKPYSWQQLKQQKSIKLYAGALFPALMQYSSHIGLCPEYSSERCILHDVRDPMPLPGNSVEIYQSEDVFEHIEYAGLPRIFDEIYRVLQPAGLFRLCMPDYRCDILRNRCLCDSEGRPVFDPGGGGRFENNKVIDGGHLWFPLLEDVLALFARSMFGLGKNVTVLHGYIDDDKVLLKPIDYSLGYIKRTPDHDPRVFAPYRPMSIVIDAYKQA